MRAIGRLGLTLLVLGMSAGAKEAGPRLVWELKLASLVGDPERGAPDVLAVRFSPDGEWIAALTARITTEGDRTELLLIPASGDMAKVRRLAIRGEPLTTPVHSGIHWSPSGAYLAVETKNFSASIIQVSDGGRCELPRATVFGGFIGADLAIAADWDLPKDPLSIPADSSRLTLYGADCVRRESWKVPGQVREVETSPRSQTIALNPEQSEIRIVGLGGREVGVVPRSTGSMLRFGEKGSVLCKADYPARGSLACYELATGQRFGHPLVVGGAPFDVSLDSSIVVATDGTSLYNVLAATGSHGLSHWVVWNYRTGEEIARYRYKGQRHAYAFSPCAVTPDGRRFLLAGTTLRMYQIPAR
jgi:hypothetical protein